MVASASVLLLYPELYLPDGEARHRDTHPEEGRNWSPDSDAVRGERGGERERERERKGERTSLDEKGAQR